MNYFDIDKLSHSKLKRIDISYNEYLKPFGDPNDATVMGSLLHEALLEPEVYKTREESTMKTVTSKTYQDEYRANGLLIPKGKKPTITKAVDIIKKHPCSIFIDGEFEIEIFAKMKGYECKSKIDIYDKENNRIIDLKTTSKGIGNINYHWWVKNSSYHTQLAFYQQMINKQYGVTPECYIMVYSYLDEDLVLLKLTDATVQEGWDKVCEWFGKLTDVEMNGAFKGISDEVIEV